MTMNMQRKTVLYVTDLPMNFNLDDVKMFLDNYKDKIMYINIDQNQKSIEQRKPLAVKVVFRDYDSANACRIEMNLRKIKGKSVRIMWDERDTSVRYNTKNNLFVKGIPKTITAREVYEYFNKFGDISSAKIIEDENGICCGYGYVTYYNTEDVKKAIEETNGKKIWGAIIEVSPFQRKNERGFNELELKNQKLYISNLPEKFTTEDLLKLCQGYGNVQSCNIFKDNKIGQNFGIVQFSSEQEAKEVLTKLDGKEVNDTKLTVKLFQNKYEHKQYIQNSTAKLNEKYQNCNLHVRNIPLTAKEEDLIKVFKNYGEIKSVKIEKCIAERKEKDKIIESTVSKGFGYISFEDEESAKNAMDSMNGKYLPGFESWSRPLIIDIFLPKYERQYMENQVLNGLNYYGTENSQMMFPNMFGAYAPMYSTQIMNAPMNIPDQYRNQFMGQRVPFHGMIGPYNSGYNNYRQPYNNVRYPPRNRGGYRGNHYKNTNNNYYPHQRQQHQDTQQQTKNNTTPLPKETKRKIDMASFEKLQTDEDKKEFLGEELFKAISESPITSANKISIDTIGKITGMIIELPDNKEIIEILENPSILDGRIKEALSLLENIK